MAERLTTRQIVRRAYEARTVIPGFNIPYLPMVEPVVRALRDAQCMGLVMVARPEWVKFEARSLAAVREEYERFKDERHTRLHLDHVPVIDEDGERVDFRAIIAEAIELGYGSVMVDGSRLPLAENVAATREIVAIARGAGVPVEAELGAVMGHEDGPIPPYEELFASGRGFTDPDEAARFVEESGCDWLSVAVGSVHGAISKARKDQRKIEARLNIEHLGNIGRATRVPLVLHGGSGIRKPSIMDAIRHGIAKINVGTAIRQPYERAVSRSPDEAREAVYRSTLKTIKEDLEVTGSAAALNPQG